MNNRTQKLLESVGALEVALASVRDAAVEKAEEIYRRAKADLEKLQGELAQSNVLDLRWAIFGLYVTTIGVALSCWA